MSAQNKHQYARANTLLALQFLSEFGDQITLSLLALCLLNITNSTTKIGFVYLLSTLGFVIFTIFGGYLGDRINRKTLLFFSESGRGTVVLAMILGVKFNSIGFIYISSFFLSMLGSLSKPSTLSIWAQSIPKTNLERYNSFSAFSRYGSEIIGPLIASLLVSLNFHYWGFALDAFTFFICAFVFSCLATPSPKLEDLKKKPELLQGFKIIFQDNKINKYVLFDASQMLCHGAFNATFLVLAQRDFGWSAANYSLHLSCLAFFSIVGAIIGATKICTNIKPILRLVGCIIVSLLSLILVLKIKVFPFASIAFGLCAMVAVIAGCLTKSKVQSHANIAHNHAISSILAARSVIIKLATLMGVGSCMALSNFYSLELSLWVHIFFLILGLLPFMQRTKKKAADDSIFHRSNKILTSLDVHE